MTNSTRRQPRKKTAQAANKKRTGSKSSSRKRTTSKSKSTPSWIRSISGYLISVFWKCFLIVVVCLAAYTIYLDAKISRQFEGNKWQLPAQVYGRSMNFYPGQYLSRDEVEFELKRLNYSEVNKLSRTGQYRKSGRGIVIYRRSFEFYNGKEQEKIIKLGFLDSKLVSLTDQRGKPVKKARLEPVQLARLNNASGQDREFVPLDKIPKMLRETLLVVEDKDFYQHHGVSPLAILRALLANIMAGRTVQGGSTLTQQLAKNFYLTRERTLQRKINEALIAIILDYRYSKDDILQAYLNEVFMGQSFKQGVHGVGLASQFYFAKPVNELEYEQIALLVALFKGPSYYNPRRHKQRAIERRDLVLRLMMENQLISVREYRSAVKRPLGIEPMSRTARAAHPAYLEMIDRELARLIPDKDVLDAGVRVFTYFDAQKQEAMEKAVEQGIPYLERRFNRSKLETSMISVNSQYGGISALVGGRKVQFDGFNRALDTQRNIGSLVKPAIYLSALNSGKYHLGSLVSDSPVTLTDKQGNTWQPDNFDHKYRGQLPLYQAFSQSINLPAVNLGLRLGIDKVSDTLNQLGVEDVNNPYPSLFLGALEMSGYQVAQMYTTLANNGEYKRLTGVAAITDTYGKQLYRHTINPDQRFSASGSYLTKYALQKVTRDGTAKRLKAHFPRVKLAGKTGTTNDLRDSWFAGFDHNTVTVAWIGQDDYKKAGLTGGQGALELYIRYLKGINPQSIADQRPKSIKWAFVSEKSGRQSAPHCKEPVVKLPIRSKDFIRRPRCGK